MAVASGWYLGSWCLPTTGGGILGILEGYTDSQHLTAPDTSVRSCALALSWALCSFYFIFYSPLGSVSFQLYLVLSFRCWDIHESLHSLLSISVLQVITSLICLVPEGPYGFQCMFIFLIFKFFIPWIFLLVFNSLDLSSISYFSPSWIYCCTFPMPTSELLNTFNWRNLFSVQ